MEKVIVKLEHDPSDLRQIWLAFSPGPPQESDWVPALRDTIDGQRVVWAKYPEGTTGNLWVKDRDGVRRVIAE